MNSSIIFIAQQTKGLDNYNVYSLLKLKNLNEKERTSVLFIKDIQIF